MDEMGHTDRELARRVYRQAMRRGENEKAQLRTLAEGGDPEGLGQRNGQRAQIESEGAAENDAA
jgi:hypothetical protein